MTSPGFAVRPAESPGAWVKRTVNGLVDPVIEHIQKAPSDPGETAHLIRVATKQLRALLRLLRPAIPERAFQHHNTKLKAIAASLATGRDRDVSRETLALLAGNPKRKRYQILMTLAPLLETGASPEADHASLPELQKAAQALDRSRHALLRMRIPSGAWSPLLQGMIKTFRRARRRRKQALSHPDDDTFHRWRIPVKQLYFQLQWLEPLWPKRFQKMIRNLHRLEKKLGSDHDLSVLQNLLTPPGKQIHPHPLTVLSKAITKHHRHLRHRAKSLGQKLFHPSSNHFANHGRQHAYHLLSGIDSKNKKPP
ncbi:MAG TPA: CHAD domain-containing protein [Verrucomicrobiales bacterium]|nr:CHAD domain-containing protein [Verrucomicrobiales bacterium]